jgi:hypothetical protein
MADTDDGIDRATIERNLAQVERDLRAASEDIAHQRESANQTFHFPPLLATTLARSNLAYFANLARRMPNTSHEGTRVWIYEPHEETHSLRSVYREHRGNKGSFVGADAPWRNVKRATDHL